MNAPDRVRRRTKLVCTIGPGSEGRLRELVAAGMDLARINFSHGTLDDHRRRARAVRDASAAAGRPVALLADLPGPKIRLGPFAAGKVELRPGSRFLLRDGGGPGDEGGASTSYERLAADVRTGDRILLADGAAELEVRSIAGGDVVTEVIRGGRVGSRQGVSVPSERLSVAALTDEDREAIPHVLDDGFDFVAQSFVRTAADLESLRALLPADGPRIVAKIETRAAVEHQEAIVRTADAIMVARGDLGVELPFERVPHVQKRLIATALAAGVPTIVATQMLESMIEAPRPTRAEVSDVANAVLDGADAVMLSAETAVGAYPIEAAEAAVRICLATEEESGEIRVPQDAVAHRVRDNAAVAAAAVELTRHDPSITAILCFTRTGQAADVLAALRPRVPILAFTPDPLVARRLCLRAGVHPCHLAGLSEDVDRPAVLAAMLDAVRQRELLPSGALTLVLGASTPGGAPTFLEVVKLG